MKHNPTNLTATTLNDGEVKIKKDLPDLLTAKEFGSITLLSEAAVWAACRRKKIPFIRLHNGKIRFRREDVLAMLNGTIEADFSKGCK